MAVRTVLTDVGVRDAIGKIKRAMKQYGVVHVPELIEEDIRAVDGKTAATLIFEKYYMRNSSQAALVVLIDDFDTRTRIKCISTAAAQGAFWKLSWGSEDEFIDIVINEF